MPESLIDSLPKIVAEGKKELNEKEWHNRLVYGDNLLVMQALLAGDPATGLPSMREKIDLIYIDPPFDSKADYRTKIILPAVGATGRSPLQIEQKPTVLKTYARIDRHKFSSSDKSRNCPNAEEIFRRIKRGPAWDLVG